MSLAIQIQERRKTPYQQIAEKYGVSYVYVTFIASGHRKPIKKKGLEVLKALQEIANSKPIEYPKEIKPIKKYSHIEIAKLCGVSIPYVRSISCGQSKCTTEKSQQVLKALQELANK